MEHACYQCGATVEDGRPFCRECNGPQIRVAVAEADPVSDAADETEPDFSSPGADSYPAVLSNPYKSASYRPGGITWTHAWSAALFGVLLAAVLTIIPHGIPVELGILCGGFFTVFFYRRRLTSLNFPLGAGARVGALSGVLGFVASVAFLSLGKDAFRPGGEFHQKLLLVLQQHAPSGADPQVRQMLEFYKSSQGFTVMVVIGLVGALAAFLVLSALGGVIGAALLKRKTNL